MTSSFLRTLALLAVTVLICRADTAPAQGPVKLNPPDQHVKLKAELLGQHPRIYFTADELKGIKEKLKDPRLATMMKWFIADADRCVALPVPPDAATANKSDIRHLEGILENLSFAYLLTGDAKYLTAWRNLSGAILSWPDWGDDLGVGHLMFGLAVSYDWLYSDLKPEERKQIETALLAHGRDMLRDPKTGKTPWWNTAYFQNHCWINHTGISTAAMAIYDVYPQEMQTWLDDSRSDFQQTYQNIGRDGGYHEGASYARYGTTWMLYYTDSLRHMTGENLFDMPFLTKVGNYFAQTMMPDYADIANFGDSPEKSWTRAIEDQILVKLAAEYHDGHMMELRDLNRAYYKDGDKRPNPSESPFALIWVDPTIAPKPLDDLPLVGLFPDLGLVVCRTGWKDAASVVAMHCGAPGGQHLVEDTEKLPRATANNGHTHPDANSYVFWADHAWRVGLPGAYTYIKATHNENTWLVGGKGQRGENLIWFEQKSYMSRPDQAHLVRVATTPQADYIVGEASPAYYDEVGLTQFSRHLLFVKGPKPYTVAFDQLAAKTPQTWTSYLHTFSPITLGADNSFQLAPALAGGSPSFGSVFGPGKMDVKAQPLLVLREHTKEAAAHGFELSSTPAGTSDSTWLVTVVGVGQEACSQVKPGPAPEIKVGSDDIAWNEAGDVTLNGKAITGNLLPAVSAAAETDERNIPDAGGGPTDATNAAASTPMAPPDASELIENGDFSNGVTSWQPQQLQNAAATFDVKEIDGGKHALSITVPQPAEKRFYVQLLHAVYQPLGAGKSYTLSFRVKSTPDSQIVVFINGAGVAAPLMKQDQIPLTSDWKTYSYTFSPATDIAASHLTISGFGAAAGEYMITDVSLKEGASGTPSAPPPATGAVQTEKTPDSLPGAESHVYRDGTPDPMRLFVYKPKGWAASDKRPALVFYFGGGWTHGTPAASEGFAIHAASLGWVGIVPDYRTKTRFGTSPLESVADSRAAFRWVQDHASELGVDPAKLIVGGHSAGGHVALWTAIDHTPPGSDANEAPHAKPAALFLLAPVSDTSKPKGYTPFRFGTNDVALSPVNQIDGKMPPLLLMHADTDEVVPYRESVALNEAWLKNGAVCDFVTVKGGKHGFPWQHIGYDINQIVDQLADFLKKNGVVTETVAANPPPAAPTP